jgi:zinc/manganese transport system permease protein
VGLMILPATAARYWTSTITSYLITTFAFALLSCWIGLIVSFYLPDVPSGPAIVLVAAVFFVFSLIFAPQGFHALARINLLRRRESPVDEANSPAKTGEKIHEKPL